MPGISSGLSPKILSFTSVSTTDAFTGHVAKFPTTHTLTDWFVAFTTTEGGTANTGVLISRMNGGVTGNQTKYTQGTGAIGSLAGSLSWTAFVAKTSSVNSTFDANDWLTARYDDALFIGGQWFCCYWAVEGSL